MKKTPKNAEFCSFEGRIFPRTHPKQNVKKGNSSLLWPRQASLSQSKGNGHKHPLLNAIGVLMKGQTCVSRPVASEGTLSFF